jgi:hypothetical protein
MVLDDDEIENARVQDQSLTAAAKREASEKKKVLKIFSAKALRAKRANHSEEWKKAWKYFYSG